MGRVGHDLKTWEIICFGRWLVDFNFWVGLHWLGSSQMYVGWCVLGWSGLDPVIFRIGPFIKLGSDWVKAFGKLAWDSTRSGLKWTRSILQWIGLTHPTNKSATDDLFHPISPSLNPSPPSPNSKSSASHRPSPPSQWRSLRSAPPLSWTTVECDPL